MRNAHAVLVCNESFREMKCIAVPVYVVAYAGNLAWWSSVSSNPNVGTL